jgi:hypothetical protein
MAASLDLFPSGRIGVRHSWRADRLVRRSASGFSAPDDIIASLARSPLLVKV